MSKVLLKEHRKKFDRITLERLFVDQPDRADKYSYQAAGIWVDFSKNHLVDETLNLLVGWAKDSGMNEAIERLFAGAIVNPSEGKPAFHPKLRDFSLPEVEASLAEMGLFVEAVRSGDRLGAHGDPITDIVTLGIGGSDLGARLVVDALLPYSVSGLTCHFVSNLDSVEFEETVHSLNPSTTLFIVASKSFTTRETMLNANRALRWLEGKGVDSRKHFVAVTANPGAVLSQSFAVSEIFCFDDAIGGRFSLWSSVGLPIALSIGIDEFRSLLLGAADMDQHFQYAPMSENLPVLLALIGAWYIEYWGAQSRAVLPYVHGLRQLPSYLRQLEMESNGKSVKTNGGIVDCFTSGVVWGASGAIGQHSFSQMLHQGTHIVPVEFISVLSGSSASCDGYTELFANCLAQSRVLMKGETYREVEVELTQRGLDAGSVASLTPHKVIEGNRPSTTILLDQLSPRRLGALLALYEHKVYVQGVLWDINSFDQWGIEYGKKMSRSIYGALKTGDLSDNLDASTTKMIDLFRSYKK